MVSPAPNLDSATEISYASESTSEAVGRGTLYLDLEQAAQAKRVREQRYHAHTVPRLRLMGMTVAAALLAVHNLLVEDAPAARAGLDFLLLAWPYSIASWWVLRRYFGRTGSLHLGDLFLILDVPLFAYIVHLGGDELSLLVPLVFVRAIDQSFQSVRRCLIALHAAPIVVVVTLELSQLAHGGMIDWRLAWAKILATYVAFLYVAIVARTAERIRQRLRDAVHVSRTLVRDLAQSSQDLLREKNRAEEALYVRSAFLANLSHDVRTPLAGILGGVDLALERSPDPELTDLLGTVRGSAESLLHCLNDLIDLSKIEAGNLQLDDEPFELEERLGTILRGEARKADLKGLALTASLAPDLPRIVHGDRLRFGQILTHLIGNAIKFTDVGEIVINVRRAGDDERVIEIAIRDTGCGIPYEQLGDVFGAYFQVDGASVRRQAGKGVGLSLSRELARAMGGDISVTSALGYGSVFRVRLAIAPALDSESSAGALSGRRIAVLAADEASYAHRSDVVLRAGATLVDLVREPNAACDAVLVDVEFAATRLDQMPEEVREHTVLVVGPSRNFGVPSELAQRPRIRLPLLPRELDHLLRLEQVPGLGRECEPAPVSGRPRRVLLVEDHPVNRKLALLHLRRWGHQVVVAEDGLEAVRAWAPGRFDLILMDIQMPHMDGMEATLRIRELERGSESTPIFAVTANALREDVERCFEVGMNRHLAKPIDFEALRKAIEELALSGHREPSTAGPSGDLRQSPAR
ncbi:response regulator [Engelhardtia mirabilis]|uniref:histidine kinase n=1 Tax=Engelhardtia mirabilis TaxID=2528011 RepID=A0A518BLK9_9BACT|nr:Signal transduction histidine-protein kinase BarA [Planctomycetes bacterium Pla133]QDV02183.1 Signal transduction histidine-protein kinase BarA [Planctomycetes bacterium Pla86]